MKKWFSIFWTTLSLFCSTQVMAGDLINGAGATFPAPLYTRWAYAYNQKTKVMINYQSVGSGAGVQQINNRTVDFGASDDALKPEDVEKNRLLQWPQVIGGVVPVINIPGVKSETLVLDAETISGIFLGNISKWNDAALRKLNPTLNLPDKEIVVVHRSDGSGTTAVFTHYLDEASPAWHAKVGQGKSVAWPVGVGGKGNEGVANYVARLQYSIGYTEFAYAQQNKLAVALLKNPAGKVVKPDLESFSEAAAFGDYDPTKHFYTWVTNTKGANSWPITAATAILLAREKTQGNQNTVKFFEWAFSAEGDSMARDLAYAPLPQALKDKVRAYWKANNL